MTYFRPYREAQRLTPPSSWCRTCYPSAWRRSPRSFIFCSEDCRTIWHTRFELEWLVRR